VFWAWRKQITAWIWQLAGLSIAEHTSHSVDARTNTRWPVTWWLTRQWVMCYLACASSSHSYVICLKQTEVTFRIARNKINIIYSDFTTGRNRIRVVDMTHLEIYKEFPKLLVTSVFILILTYTSPVCDSVWPWKRFWTTLDVSGCPQAWIWQRALGLRFLAQVIPARWEHYNAKLRHERRCWTEYS
jgi:hypothetical protein